MNKLEAGIFDSGGILHTDELKFVYQDVMETLGLSEEIFWPIWNQLTPLLGKGEISEEEYWRRFLQMSGSNKPLPGESMLLRGYKRRFFLNQEVFEIIKNLKKEGFRLAVLSNTVPCHVLFLAQQGVYDEFVVRVLSCEVGLRKPEPEIYKITLQRLKTRPEQTFYVDDDEQYVDAARTLGIHSIVFKDPNQLKKDLWGLGIVI